MNAAPVGARRGVDMEREVVVIVNPVAGSGAARGLVDEFCERVTGAGGRCDRLVPQCADELTRLVAEHADGRKVIALAGGDGTVRSALPGLAGSGNPLLILPLGTENLLATHAGLSADVDGLWQVYSHGRIAEYDLALLNGRPFATVVGVGFDAEVVAQLSRGRRGHITHFDYAWPIWQTFCRYQFPRVRVIADGEEVCNESALAFVGNIPRYAIGLQILRDAKWDDGLLDLCIFRCNHQARLMEHALWTLLNWHVEHDLVSYHQVKRVRIESETALPVQSDGDPAGTLPAEIEIRPGAIKLMVPPESG
jgi:diacylglycerol kinase family enzyme